MNCLITMKKINVRNNSFTVTRLHDTQTVDLSEQEVDLLRSHFLNYNQRNFPKKQLMIDVVPN